MVDEQQRRALWSSDVVLANGDTVHVRPIEPADAPALAALHDRQPDENLYRRYFSPKQHLTEAELEHFTTVDMVDRVGLVVEQAGEMTAWASYERWPGRDDADCAFLVDDNQQGRGIATLLLEHLAAIARSNGVTRFTAEVLGDNRAMLTVFSRAGWPVHRRFDSGVVDVEFRLDDTPEFLDTVERREHRADSRAVAQILMPRAIAVIGASDQPQTVGNVMWTSVLARAHVPVYAVNPKHDTVMGRRAYDRVSDIDDAVSLAVICVPPAALASTIDDCITARVRGAIVVTSIEGTDIDMHAIVAKARRHGLRIIGPASMGAGTTNPDIGLNAALVVLDLPPGNVSFSMQSGSLGAALLNAVHELGIGLSWFVSLGDKYDISGNDLLQFWEDDESTKVIAMYTETFGNPRKMARIARRVSRTRPIIAVRSGAASIGPIGGALYQQAGLIEVPTVPALLDTARVMSTQPVVRGPRVAVISNGQSPGTLARVALEEAGMEPVDSPVPIDWRADDETYRAALTAAIADDDIHAVLVIHAPPFPDPASTPDQVIDDVAATSDKAVVAVTLGRLDGPLMPWSRVPSFSFPEPAAACLGRSYSYHRWLESDAAQTEDPPEGINRLNAHDVIARALGDGRTQLHIDEAHDLLRAYGIPVPPTAYVEAVDASAAADAIGGLVVVKARRRHIGRSAQAGIALDVSGRLGVAAAVATMQAALGDDADHVAVQKMVPPGFDVRIRAVADPTVGPVISVGLAGFSADLVADEPTMLAPLTAPRARELLRKSRVASGLAQNGFELDDIADVVERCSLLVADHPEIVELDVNPAIVSEDACWVTDVSIRVAPDDDPELPIRSIR